MSCSPLFSATRKPIEGYPLCPLELEHAEEERDLKVTRRICSLFFQSLTRNGTEPPYTPVASVPLLHKGRVVSSGEDLLLPFFLDDRYDPPLLPRVCVLQPTVQETRVDQVGEEGVASLTYKMGVWSFEEEGRKNITRLVCGLLKEYGLDLSRVYTQVSGGNDTRESPCDVEMLDLWTGAGISLGHVCIGSSMEGTRCFFGTEKVEHLLSPLFYQAGESPLPHCRRIPGPGLVPLLTLVTIRANEKQCSGVEIDLESLARVTSDRALGESDVFDTELFRYIVDAVSAEIFEGRVEHAREKRLIADHLRTAVYLCVDGLEQENFLLQKLMHKCVFVTRLARASTTHFSSVIAAILEQLSFYYSASIDAQHVQEVLLAEVERFSSLLNEIEQHSFVGDALQRLEQEGIPSVWAQEWLNSLPLQGEEARMR